MFNVKVLSLSVLSHLRSGRRSHDMSVSSILEPFGADFKEIFRDR